MNLPKTIRQIYREETGKDAESASPLEGFDLAVYVEAPTQNYIDWLERRASGTGGSANTSTNRPSAGGVSPEITGRCTGCTHIQVSSDREVRCRYEHCCR